jgi:hypothetical protein
MRRLVLMLLLVAAGCVPASVDARRPVSFSGRAGTPYSLSVIVAGSPATPVEYRGKTWIEGRCDARYSVRITNHTGERVEVVVSVDGRDVIDGESADYVRKRGYLLGPYESYDIPGFRTTHDTAAAFRFSSVAGSYAARRGDSRNVGVIGAAFFPERRRVTVRPRPIAPRSRDRFGGGGAPAPVDGDVAEAPRGAGEAPATTAEKSRAPLADELGTGRAGPGHVWREPRPQRLGTGWGETVYSSVTEVDFERASGSRPERVLTLYYDDRAGLAAKGVPLPSDCCAPPPCWSPDCREPRPFAIPPGW